MEFDYISRYESDGVVLEYAGIYGNETTVCMKVGLGGDYLGREEKYLKMARRLHERHGCSVICISNPDDKRCRVDFDKAILADCLKRQKAEHPQLYFFGNSNGSVKGLELAAGGVPFRRMILVNMPLMINLHKTKKWLAAIPQTEVIGVYGENDPSYPYIPFFESRAENLRVIRVPGADHNFAGMTEAFIALSDRLIL